MYKYFAYRHSLKNMCNTYIGSLLHDRNIKIKLVFYFEKNGNVEGLQAVVLT